MMAKKNRIGMHLGAALAVAAYVMVLSAMPATDAGGEMTAPDQTAVAPVLSDTPEHETVVDISNLDIAELDISGDTYDGQLAAPANVRLDRLALADKVANPLNAARVSSLFGYRKNPVTDVFSFHSGYDLAAPEGAPIYAMLGGTVTTAGYDAGYGNYIIIDHGDGLQTLYGHCSKLLVKKDETVKKGQKIAKVGSTGNSTGNHLHVEFRKDGQRYDPEWILGGIYG